MDTGVSFSTLLGVSLPPAGTSSSAEPGVGERRAGDEPCALLWARTGQLQRHAGQDPLPSRFLEIHRRRGSELCQSGKLILAELALRPVGIHVPSVPLRLSRCQRGPPGDLAVTPGGGQASVWS